MISLHESALLSRDAEGLFWLARYLERVENMARLIDVTQSFESPGFESEAWFGLIKINADEENFLAQGGIPSALHVKSFYLLDKNNATSIPACLEAARTNARTLRPLISTEMWKQLNVFHRFVTAITAEDLEGDALSRLCTRIREGVQSYTGIAEGTLYRDQGWYFYELGRYLERADQTTRMLDIKYTAILPRGGEEKRVADLTQWSAILRVVSGYYHFKRLARAEFSAQDVVQFLLRDSTGPRSVLLCVRQIEAHLRDLNRHYGLTSVGEALERVEWLLDFLIGKPIDDILVEGLHEYLDLVQIHLQELAGAIGRTFFRDWQPVAAVQMQIQS